MGGHGREDMAEKDTAGLYILYAEGPRFNLWYLLLWWERPLFETLERWTNDPIQFKAASGGL